MDLGQCRTGGCAASTDPGVLLAGRSAARRAAARRVPPRGSSPPKRASTCSARSPPIERRGAYRGRRGLRRTARRVRAAGRGRTRRPWPGLRRPPCRGAAAGRRRTRALLPYSSGSSSAALARHASASRCSRGGRGSRVPRSSSAASAARSARRGGRGPRPSTTTSCHWSSWARWISSARCPGLDRGLRRQIVLEGAVDEVDPALRPARAAARCGSSRWPKTDSGSAATCGMSRGTGPICSTHRVAVRRRSGRCGSASRPGSAAAA